MGLFSPLKKELITNIGGGNVFGILESHLSKLLSVNKVWYSRTSFLKNVSRSVNEMAFFIVFHRRCTRALRSDIPRQHSRQQHGAGRPWIRVQSTTASTPQVSQSGPEINPANTMEMWPNKQTEERANGLPNQQRFSLTVQKMHQNIVTDEGICGTRNVMGHVPGLHSTVTTNTCIYLLLLLCTEFLFKHKQQSLVVILHEKLFFWK